MPVPNNFLLKKCFQIPHCEKMKTFVKKSKSSTSRSNIMACCRRTWHARVIERACDLGR